MNLLKRVLASMFVLLGGGALVTWIWPEGTINTLAEAFEAVIAIFGFGTSLVVVWSLWFGER